MNTTMSPSNRSGPQRQIGQHLRHRIAILGMEGKLLSLLDDGACDRIVELRSGKREGDRLACARLAERIARL